MAKETKVRRIGNSLGIVLPKEILHELKVGEGASLYITGDAGGAVRLTPERPGFKEKMAVAEKGMRRYRNALKELAK
jgi:putative addiction module antidote